MWYGGSADSVSAGPTCGPFHGSNTQSRLGNAGSTRGPFHESNRGFYFYTGATRSRFVDESSTGGPFTLEPREVDSFQRVLFVNRFTQDHSK